MKPIYLKTRLHILCWWLLRYNRVFKYWYVKFLNELLYDIELCVTEEERREIKGKYLTKLADIKKWR